MGGIVRKCNGALLQTGGIANHVHLLIELSNLDGFTSVIRTTKAASCMWLKQTFSEATSFAWQDGYGSFSVSKSQIEIVREYIRTQERHHQKFSFEEEYKKILDSHQVEYNEKYLFD